MKTNTKEEIISEVHKSIHDHGCSAQRFRQLKSVLGKNDPSLVGEALLTYWHTLTNPDKPYQSQQFVASLLLALNPKSPFHLSSLTEDLANWNLSVEEFPRYLALQFGKDRVLQEFDVLVSNHPDNQAIVRAAETVRYWLKIDFDAAKTH